MTSLSDRHELEVVIDTLGAQGDGIATSSHGPLYVPFALPGEKVLVDAQDGGKSDLIRIIKPSTARVKPPCKHFRQCGGCAMQHLELGAYHAWKEAQVGAALAARGIHLTPDPMVTTGAQTRRRATFAATRTKKGGVTIGYYAAGTHNIIPLDECPLVVPEIVAALPMLATIAGAGISRAARAAVAVTSTDTGLDVAITGGKEMDGVMRAELGRLAEVADLARLSWNDEIVAERKMPYVTLSGLSIILPPGSFLQPTREGEAALVRLVLEGVGEATAVADLFAGCGTFTAALALKAGVLAVESEAAPLAALDRALREQGPLMRLKPVTLEKRDLFRRPLLPVELEKFDAVVFDPPRAGADIQANELAQSKVKTVVAVSCNPATFARDARILMDGGYKLTRVTPVDQFLWSPHIEVVGVFRRA